MLKYLLFFFLSFSLEALELSLSGAKENFQHYSTLHLKDPKPFLCQELVDDFKVVTKVICAFNKRPSVKINNLQNSFFKIENQVKKDTFFLIISPFHKIKLYPMIFDMTKDETLYQANIKMSNHWMLIAYKDKIPFIKKEQMVDTAINFPFQLGSNKLPFVGGLDIKGNPVHIKRVGDVTQYLKIKKLYKEFKYEKCLELVESVMQDYPSSLFNAEFIFYKIRIYAKLNDNDSVISLSKEFLREYSSDENIPEVLALVAKSYAEIGMSTDADYFFDRLFSEHESSKYTQWGYIYKAEMLERDGVPSKALHFYKKALDETEDIDIALSAAYKLANYKVINSSDKKEASQYIMKIVNTQADFFMNDLVKSLDIMYRFADASEFETAAIIAKSLVDAMKKDDDEYEVLLKDRGMWLSKTDDKQKALSALNDYIKEFVDGVFIDIVEIAKDELFFDTNDANYSIKLAELDYLIEEYDTDTIGNRAVYEKGKLLLEYEKYSEVLDMEESILELDAEFFEDKEDIIVDSAIGEMKLALKNRECQKVLNISNDYNITLSNDWDDGVYECSMMGGDYRLSKEVASRNLKSKNLDLRKLWLFRYIKVDFATGNYSNVIEASQELIVLISDEDDSKYKEIYRIIFDTYERVEKNEKLLESIINIQKIFSSDYKDIERYVSVMSMGNDIKDDNIVIKYGEEVMKIQDKSSSFAQSPFVEFTMYQAYLNIDNLDKALDIIVSLDRVDLKKSDRARQKYLLGSILLKLWRNEEAKEAYQESIDADSSSPWAELAKSSIEDI